MSDKEKPAEPIEEKPPVVIEDNEEDVITIGEDSPPQEKEEAPAWVKEVRKNNRQLSKDNRDLKEQLAKATGTTDKIVELGAKPTLEKCGYSEAKYEADLDSYHERKIEISKISAKREAAAEKEKGDWNKQLDSYGEKKAALNVKDFDDAEAIVREDFSDEQQGIIIAIADNSAVVTYALGKNPQVAKDLAAIKNPAKFIAAMVKLETQLKVSKRKPASAPEEALKGSHHTVDSDKALDKLRDEADRTGNYSKVAEHRRKQRSAG